ncbi:MAG TPA: FAD-dependent monooxygenase, partial [Euzebya sp.]|nr:FAD-dependent monooxygenase [Euzebya sp.]
MFILVVGASIAGLSMAQRLSERGHDVTVVERSADLRRTGAPIDVRGEALRVAADMRVLDHISVNRVANTRDPAFTTFVDEAGDEVAMLPVEYTLDSPEDIEIARDKLIDILHGAIDPSVEFVFGDAVTDVIDTGAAVEVTFASRDAASYDLVVGADGIHSSTRRSVFGPESRFRRHLGLYTAIVEVPAELGVPLESHTYNVPGRMATISDFGDRALGWLAFRAPELDYDHTDLEAQRRLLLDAYDGVTGWRVEEILQAFATATDFYFDSVSQVHMDQWSAGRVVLVGDAAHAASLLSGRGTS